MRSDARKETERKYIEWNSKKAIHARLDKQVQAFFASWYLVYTLFFNHKICTYVSIYTRGGGQHNVKTFKKEEWVTTFLFTANFTQYTPFHFLLPFYPLLLWVVVENWSRLSTGESINKDFELSRHFFGQNEKKEIVTAVLPSFFYCVGVLLKVSLAMQRQA